METERGDAVDPIRALLDEWESEFTERLIRSNSTPKLSYREAIDRLRAASRSESELDDDRCYCIGDTHYHGIVS